jgi:nucleotide-binding universal stress UspA family protein
MSADSGGVVLAAVDGSAEAADAVDVAAQLARAWNAELHLVHVWSGLASALTGVIAEGAARRLLADESAYAARRGAVISEQHFLIGPAAGNIERLGDELGAVLCVMGQHRRSRVGRLLFGSVAAEILGVTARPLLLVSSAADWPPRRVLIGDDGSPAALAAARLAAQIGGLYHAEVELVRADGPALGGGRDGADVTVAEQGLAADGHQLEPLAGGAVRVAVVHASPYAVLQQGGPDDARTLVAIGSRQHGGLVRWVEGSVSLQLVHSADTLLVVPAAGAGVGLNAR